MSALQRRRAGHILEPEAEAAITGVLAFAYRGMHHVPYWEKREITSPTSCVVKVYGNLDTYDSDVLTRLVIAAHDEAVRVEVLHGRPPYVRLALSKRKRCGSVWDRHPTLDETLVRLDSERRGERG